MGRARNLGVVAAALFAVAAAAVPASAGPSFHSTIDPSTVKESIAYLVQTYGVDEREALRRLELQNDANELDGILKREAAGEYGGNRRTGGSRNARATRVQP